MSSTDDRNPAAPPSAPPEANAEALELDYSAAHGTPLSATPPLPAADKEGGTADPGGATGAAREQVERAVRGTGRGLQRLAASVRAGAGESDRLRARAAAALEGGGGYLGRVSAQEARGDLERTIRRRPLASLLVGVGIGVALGLLGGRRRRS